MAGAGDSAPLQPTRHPIAMNLSGILVTADPSALPAVLASLATLPGVEVRDIDATRGRVVVVQEAPDVGAEVEGFTRIRALPHVINADLVCHYFDDDASPAWVPEAATTA